MNRTSLCVLLSLSALAAAFTTSVLLAGPLNPPAGPVASTAKTLNDVEPRIAISSLNTPGDADSVFKITQSGTYYLTGNVAVPAAKSAIEIQSQTATDVVIDLNGFSLEGDGTASLYGVTSGLSARVWVRNGAIRNFGTSGVSIEATHVLVEQLHILQGGNPGIVVYGSGVLRDCDVQSSRSGITAYGTITIERCTASNNSGYGILANGNCSIIDCSAESNDSAGIIAGLNSVVRSCRAINNTQEGFQFGDGVHASNCESNSNTIGIVADDQVQFTEVVCRTNTSMGISAQMNCTLRNCTTIDNGGAGVSLGTHATVTDCVSSLNRNGGEGFKSGANSTFINCTAIGNASNGLEAGDASVFTGCTSNDNTGRGISAFNGAHITGCLTRNNLQDGIYVNFSSVVCNNNCNGDGSAPGNHGAIRVIGQANRIEGNNISYADRGLLVDSGGNVIIRNTVKGCTLNWSLVANNLVGPILDRTAPASAAISGNSAPSSLGSTDPNANFTY